MLLSRLGAFPGSPLDPGRTGDALADRRVWPGLVLPLLVDMRDNLEYLSGDVVHPPGPSDEPCEPPPPD